MVDPSRDLVPDAPEAREASGQLWRAVVEDLADGVVVQDAEGRIIASNPAARSILGPDVDSLMGRTSFDPAWHAVRADGTPALPEEHPATIARVTGRPVTGVVMGVRDASGLTRWLRVNARPLRDQPGGAVTGAAISFSDITEMRCAEQALRDSEALLNRTQELTRSGGWAYDVAAKRQTWTAGSYRVHDLPVDGAPLEVEQVTELYAPEDQPVIAEAFRSALEEGRPHDLDLSLVTAAGREIWVRTGGRAESHDGRTSRVSSHLQDITAERDGKEELRLAHARLRRFVDANIIGVVIARPDGSIIEANQYYLDLVGYSPQELERGEVDWRAVTPEEWLPADERAVAELRERGVCTPYEKEYQRRDGGRVSVLLSDALLPGPGEEIAAFALDITDRKRAEARLTERQAVLQNVIDNAEAVVFTVDRDYRYTSFNPQHAGIMKALYHVDIELGASILDYERPSGDHVQAQKNLDRALAGERFTDEVSSGDDEQIRAYFEVSHGPVWDAQGRIVGASVFARDTSARRRAEDELRHLNDELEQRVVARTASLEVANRELEAFSYSVSHDLRAPLRSIDGYSEILLRDHAVQLDAEAQRLLAIVVRNARQMGDLIDDLLAFSRVARTDLERRPIDMERLARSVSGQLSEAELGRDLAFDVGPLAPVSGDLALLRQVWTNLLGNAAKFSAPVERARIEIRCERRAGECCYTVRDNGVGFDQRYAGKLFQPFQRLHATSEFEGTGIGLAIVARIVGRHGGRVWAEGTPGVGATFGFSLPEDAEES